ALLTECIPNWRKEHVGVLCHVTDLTYLYRVFDALRLLQTANDTQRIIDNTVTATQLLGHEWGRLYQIRRDEQTVFVGKASYGRADPEGDDSFGSGYITLTPEEDASASETWHCIRKGMPVVFCHRSDLPDGAKVTTDKGLEATNVREPS